jgi:prefoldin subunit 5
VPEDIQSLKDISERLAAIQAKLSLLQAEIQMLKLLSKILEKQ